MVSVLDSRSSSPGSCSGSGTALCSWARHFFLLTAPLSTQVYKWVPANIQLGVTLASHPGRRRVEILQVIRKLIKSVVHSFCSINSSSQCK